MNDLYEKIVEYRRTGVDSVLVTATEKSGEGPVEVGKKMLATATGRAFGTVGGGALEFYAREKCKEIIKARKHLTERYVLCDGKVVPDTKTMPMACGGVVTLFYEFVGSREYVYIFGGGHCGQALVKVIKPLGFHVTVIDERAMVVDQFEGADVKINAPFTDFIDKNGIREGSYVIVCTPSHLHDYHVLNMIIERKLKPRYLGMLCSLKKIKEYLEATYKNFGKDVDLANFYAPIGLQLGGSTPEDIAISIASEMLVVEHGETGHKHMRDLLDGDDRYWKD